MKFKINRRSEKLESEVFNTFTFLASILLSGFLLHDLILRQSFNIILVDVTGITLLVTGYILSKYYNFYDKVIFPLCIIFLVVLSYCYTITGGLRGETIFHFILFIFAFSVLLRKEKRIIMTVLTFLCLAILFYIEPKYPMLFSERPSGHTSGYLLAFLTTVIFIMSGISIVKNRYDKANNIIQNKNIQLMIKNYWRPVKKQD
ncbi:MAG: hypothetical protein ACK4ND_19030 [Cytophagaceae bacterium]